jgi:single-strand DNA-binding protein
MYCTNKSISQKLSFVQTSLEIHGGNWTNKDGEPQSRTEWHRIEAWGRLGEICGEYLSKGRQVYIEGSLQTDEWEDQEGNKRQTTKIKAWKMQMLGSRGPAESLREEEDKAEEPASRTSEDDIPF